MKDSPRPRSSFCLINFKNQSIFVIGSKDTLPVDCYDPLTDSWSSGPDLNIPREDCIGCALQDHIYIFDQERSIEVLNATKLLKGYEEEWNLIWPKNFVPYSNFSGIAPISTFEIVVICGPYINTFNI